MQKASFFRIAMRTGAWMVLAFLLLPMLVVVPVSLTDHSYISLPGQGLSLAHYVNYFTNPRWLEATWQSVVIGVAVSALATLLGTAFAVGCWFLSDFWATVARWVLITPLLVPPVVQALGFYRFWVQLGLIDTLGGVILAHTLLALPYVTISVFAALANLDRRIPQAARSLGASVWTTVISVVVPAARPGMLAGALFAFIVSFDEIVAVLFLTVRNVQTLPKMIWQGIQDNIDPTIAAVATVLTLLTASIMVVVSLRRRN
ncbi:putative spermidine/putrescine transport system permease protein [Tistlia consotensis]|uniref:Putative spermidine/putrescine transport system permease protein n=1 Tax=Tistlia consotensis USBA 355 TaxID=560819 RepID=A0A1Y6BA18_9PROT|nr:ABC transporter permease [Tistlia consotensis]SME92633.1 putative spermidine/putrescine transport system permease protein [Tistlia consotensis USBA 355]SNR28142.1 putative spermidine/putrescine transport system permease protein [Tistlia consotensis]